MHAKRLADGSFLISCRMDSTPEDVQTTLTGLKKLLCDEALAPPEDCHWELVVAEVLNNIVEHAYEDRAGGEIRLTLNLVRDRLCIEFVDFGQPMPGGSPPEGAPANLDVDINELPEGGFGWFLIRALSENLAYSHDGRRNHLTLCIPLTQHRRD